MTNHTEVTDPAYLPEEGSLLPFANLLLRHRRLVTGLALACGLIAGVTALLSRRLYESRAVFLPQSSEESLSGLALAASQLGVEVPTSPGGGWGAGVYARIIQSDALLAAVIADSIVVEEEGGRKTTLTELFKVKASDPARLSALTIRALRNVFNVHENKTIGSVEVSVRTRWPSVSQVVAERMVRSVHQFNLEKLQAKAAAERQFIESRAALEEVTLRTAEGRLQAFLQQNRVITNSPELVFRKERLERDVQLHEQLYTSLLKGLDEARIREVRNTPVITVVEEPRRAVIGVSRQTLLKAGLGGFVGVILAVVWVLVKQGASAARLAEDPETREFFRLLEESLPASLRRLLQ